MGENGFEIIRKYMYILKIKSTYLNALLSFTAKKKYFFLAVENQKS